MDKNETAGQPPFFDNPEDLQIKINEYFEHIKGEYEMQWITDSDDDGKPIDKEIEVCIRKPEPPTITGLCLFLGFESRQSFYDYGNRDKFSYTIKRARMMIENGYELAMYYAKNPTGAIFALKNLGWTDKQEIDNKSSDGSMTPKATQIVFTKGSNDK